VTKLVLRAQISWDVLNEIDFHFTRSHDRVSGDYAGSASDIHSVTSRLSQISVSLIKFHIDNYEKGRRQRLITPRSLYLHLPSPLLMMMIKMNLIKFMFNLVTNERATFFAELSVFCSD